MTTNPYVRPDDYGIPITAQHHDDKTVRNIKLPWQEIKRHANPLWEKGYQFYCVTPKTRHRVHSQWSVNDWVQIYESNFGDPYRMDKRTPGVGEHQLHINPQAAKDRGINDGDYVYVDGNPVDRPYRGWKPSRSVLQGGAPDDPGQVQPGLSRTMSRWRSTPRTWPRRSRSRAMRHARTGGPLRWIRAISRISGTGRSSPLPGTG